MQYLNDKYSLNTITFSWSSFNTLKKNISYQKKFFKLREKRFDNITLGSEKLMKLKLIYPDNKIDKTIRIFGTKNSLKLLSDEMVTQYFIDGTYKCVPHSLDTVEVLIILIAYNNEYKQFEHVLAATLNKEDADIYNQFYGFLKFKYDFNPSIITCDFSKSNISSIKKVYPKTTIITCFFHLIQAWWRKAALFKLRTKNIITKTRTLIFNLKLLPFMNKDTAIDFYNEIKNTFDDEIFNEFYEYFELTWLNPDINIKTKFEFSLWSYHGKFDFKNQRKKYLISDEALDNYIFVSNNACESLNNLINNYIEINSKVSLIKIRNNIKSIIYQNGIKQS